jgi:hypothetical protein
MTRQLLRRSGENGRTPRFRYLVDQDGLAHVVFDAEAIGETEIRDAARLFGLHHEIPSIVLDGSPLAG